MRIEESAMKRFVVFGAAQNGIKIKRWLKNNNMGKVEYFADNNCEKHGLTLEDVKIISMKDMISELDRDKELECIIAIIELTAIVDSMRDYNIKNSLWGLTREFLFNYEIDNPLYEIDCKKPRLDYFEYHVADHCNLNCKGCGHFSNVLEKRFGNLEQYKADLVRLKELFWGARWIRLMGGEPLLNPELPEFIKITRNVFPDANIRVVTNGLLLPTASKDVFTTMKENGVEFDISSYRPTQALKNRIILKCIENDVRFAFEEGKDEFFCQDNIKGDSDMVEEFNNCFSKECHYLEDGKIATCISPIIRFRKRDMLGMNYPYEGNYVDIYDDSLDGFEVLRRINSPIENCKYCNTFNPKVFPWEGNYRELIDIQKV